MMLFEWFNVREAAAVGAALADQFAPRPSADAAARGKERAAPSTKAKAFQDLLRRADIEVRSLRLNVYKRAKLANSFKWRLLENGVEKAAADEVTRNLVLHLFQSQADSITPKSVPDSTTDRSDTSDAEQLLLTGNHSFARADYAGAIKLYEDVVRLRPRQAEALNNLGASLCKVGRYQQAEDYVRRAIEIKPNYPEAHNNLGSLRRWKGHFAGAEISLRRALKLKPTFIDARTNLGLALTYQGRLREAKVHFEKVLRVAPRHIDALFGMGQIAQMEGRFEEAAALFDRVLALNPNMPGAWAAQAGLRKMAHADGAWLERAERIAASGITPVEEAELRFAIGKYLNDVGNFERAFQSYKLANELMKGVAENYARDARKEFVDDLMRVYTPEAVAQTGQGVSASTKPIFVVGMMRSGTSLAEQIIASHPQVRGAGEVAFWGNALREYESDLRRALIDEPIRKKLAEAYLRELATHCVDAPHVVDKTPVNADYLGIIHSIFPDARIIYMQRNPLDTCVSCYFQQLSPALNYAMDLSDLAHYYRQHQRLMAHWRAVLPQGTILDVPYEELVADQEKWTRKILDFVGLEWDERCLDFHKTERPVATASFWQVRQRIYSNSVERWHNYEKYIGPLLGLRGLM
jgi:tetratricopeptide (TPR) repeat protein